VDSDSGSSLVLDSAGDAYVAGGTNSADFPTTPGAFDTVLNDSEAFVTKINATGSALVFSTFVGGSASEGASSIALGAGSNIYITGGTSSVDFPMTPGAFDPQFNGGVADAFVAGLNANGSALIYSTFLGGQNSEGGFDLALDAAGGIYVTGQTMSPDFPTTPGAVDRIWNGDPLIFWADAFVAKLTVGSEPPPAAALSSVAVNPSSVVGGNGSTGTVTLTSVAPAGGLAVTLSSNHTAATVPAGVTVTQGTTSRTFTITISSVTVSTPVTISASAGGVTRTATITVSPAAQGATLTVTATGRSGERVTSTPAGVNVPVGSTGTASFATGTSITLRVTNNRDATWSGACSSGGEKTRTCTFTLNGNASVSANVR
jgi:hypothetical protein